MRAHPLRRRRAAAVMASAPTLLAALVVATPTATAAAGTWTQTDPMVTTRNSHTATLLPDGKVLVAGGWKVYPATDPLSSAEIFDPSTGTWSATGSMNRVHAGINFKLFPLSDGKVLALGNPVDIFDPATGTWTEGDTSEASGGWIGETLPGDKVLTSGGLLVSPWVTTSTRDAFLYDRATDQWSQTTSMITNRFAHSATLLDNGTALIAGGTDTEPNVLDKAETFNPANETWTATADMPNPRRLHPAVRLNDGTVLLAGGRTDTGQTTTADIFDPANSTWTAAAGMAFKRYLHTLTVLSDGKVLAAGHTDLAENANAVPEVFTP